MVMVMAAADEDQIEGGRGFLSLLHKTVEVFTKTK
jgi:hypothetical protein